MLKMTFGFGSYARHRKLFGARAALLRGGRGDRGFRSADFLSRQNDGGRWVGDRSGRADGDCGENAGCHLRAVTDEHGEAGRGGGGYLLAQYSWGRLRRNGGDPGAAAVRLQKRGSGEEAGGANRQRVATPQNRLRAASELSASEAALVMRDTAGCVSQGGAMDEL